MVLHRHGVPHRVVPMRPGEQYHEEDILKGLIAAQRANGKVNPLRVAQPDSNGRIETQASRKWRGCASLIHH